LTKAFGGADGNAREHERREEAMKSVLVEKGKTFTPEHKFAGRSQLHIKG
jgi:hypothetical protein